jgi:vitamin B12 transporter
MSRSLSSVFNSFSIAIAGTCTLFGAHAHGATLDEVVVTATRVPQPIEEIIGDVDVITRADIEHLQPQSVQELLRYQTGIDVTSQGGLGKLTGAFIRGTESEHVLVLIDGVRAGSVTAGFTAFEFLPVEQIERVEIVRGPRSSLYGSDAIGGVIQIFTRKGGDTVSARIGGGTYDTFIANGSVHLQADDTSLTATAGKHSTQGFNSCRGSGALFQGCFTDEPDRDGFSSRTGSLNINHRASFGEFELGALFAEGHTEYDGSFQNETDFRQFAPHVRTTVDLTDNWDLTFIAGATRDDQDYMHNGEFRSTYNTERRSASLQSDVKLPANQVVTVGADFLDDTIDSTDAFTLTSRDNGGVFGQYQVGVGSHRVSLSARYDDNQQFGSHTTGNAGWKWQIAPSFFTSASWGKAFRAPSFNDLYSPFGGNVQLLPEKSESYELGFGGAIGKIVTWKLNGYQTDIDDLIELNSSFEPENTARARIKGAEVEATVTLDSTSIAASYSYIDPRNTSAGPNNDKILQRRSRQSAHLQVTQQLGPVRASVIGRSQGRRFNDATNNPARELGSYAVLDLFGEYAFNEQWQLDAKLTNILDKRYETVYWYNEAGFAFLASVRYRMK